MEFILTCFLEEKFCMLGNIRNLKICIVCPSIYSSTTARSGQGWLFVPEYEANNYNEVEMELEKYASKIEVEFNTTNTMQFMKNVKHAKKCKNNM